MTNVRISGNRNPRKHLRNPQALRPQICRSKYNEGVNQPIGVRNFRAGDFARLLEIDQSCFDPGIAYSRSELSWYIRRAGSVTRVAEIDGQIVGFAVGNAHVRGIAHVITLDVDAAARRKGIGTTLMGSLHEEFRKRESRISILEVSLENAGAIRFYETLGYERGEVLAGYYNGKSDALRMFRLFPRAPNP